MQYNTKEKSPPSSELLTLVELVENNLHPINLELERWQGIIGERYFDHKLKEQRNSLTYKP